MFIPTYCDDTLIMYLNYDKDKFDSNPRYQIAEQALNEIKSIQRKTRNWRYCINNPNKPLELAARYVNTRFGLIYYCSDCHGYMSPGSVLLYDELKNIVSIGRNNPHQNCNIQKFRSKK